MTIDYDQIPIIMYYDSTDGLTDGTDGLTDGTVRTGTVLDGRTIRRTVGRADGRTLRSDRISIIQNTVTTTRSSFSRQCCL